MSEWNWDWHPNTLAMREAMNQLSAEVERYAKQVAQLDALRHEAEKDAERYRYMRSHARFEWRNGPGLYWYLPRTDRDMPYPERLDKEIDAAMGEQK